MKRFVRSVALVGTVLTFVACQKEEKKSLDLSQEMVKAIVQGNPAEVKALLDKGEAVDAKQAGQTALHMASMNGKVDIISVLIARGAQVDAVDDQGITPMMLAAKDGRVEAVQALLAQGAKIEAQNKMGENALHIAGAHGKKEVVTELLDRGANIRATTNNGLNVLVFALNRMVQPGATTADTALVEYIKGKFGNGADTVKSTIAPMEEPAPAKPAKKSK
jgi:predicted LPLAT superfamily acyltransferase